MPCQKPTIKGPAKSSTGGGGGTSPPSPPSSGSLVPGVSNTTLIAAGAGVVGLVALSGRKKKNG